MNRDRRDTASGLAASHDRRSLLQASGLRRSVAVSVRRQGLPAANALECFRTIHARHHDIKQDEIERDQSVSNSSTSKLRRSKLRLRTIRLSLMPSTMRQRDDAFDRSSGASGAGSGSAYVRDCSRSGSASQTASGNGAFSSTSSSTSCCSVIQASTRIEKHEPCPKSLFTVMSPPMRTQNFRLSARPRPVPP